MSNKSNSSDYKTFMYTCCLCYTSLLHLSMYQMLILSVRLHTIDFVHEFELNTNSSSRSVLGYLFFLSQCHLDLL